MRVLILLLVLCNSLFAQYDSTMYDLIKTTFERSFDKAIVSKHLHSDSDQNTKAALLSIAQSEDTSFIPELLKLDLNKYGSEVCFALAQIGRCDQSIEFLWKYLHSSPLPDQFPKIFFALGKIGDETDLNKLVEFYNSFDGPIFPIEGISEAILQFQIRGIKSDDARAILETEIIQKLSTESRIKNALFALARYRSSNLTDEQLQNLFQRYFADDTEYKQFLLMNITKDWNADKDNLFINNGSELRRSLLNIGLSKVLHCFHYFMKNYPDENINDYFALLNDSNPNVALQSAISIKNIESYINDSLKTVVKNKIDSKLLDLTKSMSFKGELFLSRFELIGGYEEHDIILNELELPTKYQIQFYIKNPNKEIAFSKISDFYLNSSELKDKIESLSQILELKSGPKYEADFNTILITSLTSNYAPLISIAADGIDSIFILSKSNELKVIISNQIDKFKNNPDFLEATMSLINLAEKIDTDFYELMIEKVKSSKLYSVRKFAATKIGIKQIGFKELDKFEDIWQNAFKYKQATIKTSKGNIVIKFDSEIAPISVANFCMLAEKDFYNGIIFHRVVPGFVIQAGDPTATGWGGPGYDIVSEYSDTDFGIGYVGMASSGKDTEGSQFFIMHGSHPHLNSRYTLFAKVIEGMDVVYNINEDDKIITIELE